MFTSLSEWKPCRVFQSTTPKHRRPAPIVSDWCPPGPAKSQVDLIVWTWLACSSTQAFRKLLQTRSSFTSQLLIFVARVSCLALLAVCPCKQFAIFMRGSQLRWHQPDCDLFLPSSRLFEAKSIRPPRKRRCRRIAWARRISGTKIPRIDPFLATRIKKLKPRWIIDPQTILSRFDNERSTWFRNCEAK